MNRTINLKNPMLHGPLSMRDELVRKKRNFVRSSKLGVILVILTGMFAWQCSKMANSNTPQSTSSLKATINTSAQNLSDAVAAISQTYGYKVLSLNENSTLKSTLAPVTFQDSITLAKIKGVYEYQPSSYRHWCFACFDRLFKRTGDSNDLIVKMPSVKVFYPAKFRMVTQSDSSLKNNLVIDASDYHYYFSMGMLWDYKLAANVTLNDTAIGNIGIQSSRSSHSTYGYSSSYGFPNGYGVSVNVKSGDTATSSIALTGNSGTLLKETVNRFKPDSVHFRRQEYILDIGNIEFKKMSGVDSFMIYVSGVLQTHAKVQVVDTTEAAESICDGRDLKITFDDGTTTTLSALLGPSLTVLKSLVVNLQNVFFATNVVDYIAFNIFRNQQTSMAVSTVSSNMSSSSGSSQRY
jgi:hypothetical protein